jgi:hypothetical protein
MEACSATGRPVCPKVIPILSMKAHRNVVGAIVLVEWVVGEIAKEMNMVTRVKRKCLKSNEASEIASDFINGVANAVHASFT